MRRPAATTKQPAIFSMTTMSTKRHAMQSLKAAAKKISLSAQSSRAVIAREKKIYCLTVRKTSRRPEKNKRLRSPWRCGCMHRLAVRDCLRAWLFRRFPAAGAQSSREQ